MRERRAVPHSTFIKPIPDSVAIFGANGHIGGPMARFLRFHAPNVRLRLIGSSAEKVEQLRRQHPYAEAVQANYYEPSSLDAALAGIQGLLVITTTGTDEAPAMSNLVAAVRKSGSLIHMIRLVGMFPDFNLARIPQALRDFGMGLEIQHPIARQVLDDAQMPATYFNIGSSYMDNYLRLAGMIREEGVLRWHDRRVPYIDPREVGEAAARILLSNDARHLYQFYTLNNGQPGLRSSDVARMMTDVFLRPIRHDGSREGLFKFFQPLIDMGAVPAAVPEYLWNMFELEEANAHMWVPNQFLESVLGHQPTTMRAWLQEHRRFFGDETEPARLSGAALTNPSSR